MPVTTAAADCVDIGTNAAAYTLTDADVGYTVQVTVTATNSAGQAVASSTATGTVAAVSAPQPVFSPDYQMNRTDNPPVICASPAVEPCFPAGSTDPLLDADLGQVVSPPSTTGLDPCTPVWSAGNDNQFRTFGQESALSWKPDALVSSLQAAGGNLMINFDGGDANTVGLGGNDLALACTDPAKLEAAYVSALDTYHVNALMFDIEGSAVATTGNNVNICDAANLTAAAIAANANRATAIYNLQQQRPGLTVWVTVSARTNCGLYPYGSVEALRALLNAGVHVAGVMVAVMNFNTGYGDNMSDYGIDAIQTLQKAHSQLATEFPGGEWSQPLTAWQHMGVEARIGDVVNQSFTPAEAQELAAFADRVGLGRESFWAIHRDFPCSASQQSETPPAPVCAVSPATPHGFSNIFMAPVGPINTTAPAVTGTTQRTYTLTGSQGSWSGDANIYSYQWQSSADGITWTNVTEATSATYKLGVSDEGNEMRVLVTASNVNGIATQASPPSAIIAPFPVANISAPTISGTPERTYVLTSTQGTWSGPDNTYSDQWQRNAGDGYYNIVGATGPSYTLTVADENATVRLVVYGSDPDGTIMQASAPTGLVTGAVPLNTTAPALSGTAARASTLTASQGVWQGVNNSYAYQWQHSIDGTSWTSITGATSSSYPVSASDEGTYLRMQVTATNSDGTATAVSAASALIVPAPPVNTASPAVSGTAQRTSTLLGAQGTWSGIGNSYAYQWQRSVGGGAWTNISGATSLSYTLGVADEGANVRLTVTAYNADGTATADSPQTTTVQGAAPAVTAAPAVSGSTQRAQTLTATQGAWAGLGNTYAYQWQHSTDNGTTWANITGATSLTYTLGVTDEGSQLRMTVIATNPDGTATSSSAATAVVPAAPPVNTAAPAVSGTAQRGQTLTATQGTWNGIGNAYAYQWQYSADATTWTNIAGATSLTYTVAVANEATKLRLLVTATNPDATIARPTAATATVIASAPAVTAAPAVSGTAQRGQILTATQGTWSGIGNAYADQWQRSADNGTTWTNIAGATSSGYTIAVADEFDKLRVLITAVNPDGAATAASSATATIPSAPPVNTTAPAITGTVARASTLTVSQGAWTGIANTYTIQWQRSADSGTTWTSVTGATSSTYTLGVADEGDLLRAQVTATNPDATVTASTTATGTVPSAPPANTAAPTVTGTVARASTLTVSQGTWNGIGNTYAIQWQHNAGSGFVNITGATTATYTVAVSDENATLRAQEAGCQYILAS